VTTLVAADVAVAVPPELAAVTTTRIVWLTSLLDTGYEALVAPLIAAQPAPDESQSCH
jgi:hypothetical protein